MPVCFASASTGAAGVAKFADQRDTKSTNGSGTVADQLISFKLQINVTAF